MNAVTVLAALALAAGLVWWWQNARRQARVQADQPISLGVMTQVNIPCGQPWIIGPFRGGHGSSPPLNDAAVFIKVIRSCANNELGIETETARGDWVQVTEYAPEGTPADKPPRVGSFYVVSLPLRCHIRITCPAGSGGCALEVTEFSRAGNMRFDILSPQKPACGEKVESRLLNLGLPGRKVKVRVDFSKLCIRDHQAAPGVIEFEVVSRPRPDPTGIPRPLPRIAPITVNPPAPANGTVDLPPGYTLKASCGGDSGECEISMRMEV